ncbi:MAG: hypothetical protein ABW352_05495, partial [Polyangiales bacterium]
MKRLVLALSLSVVACGDDAPPDEDQPQEPAPRDASRPADADTLDAARDAAPGLLDAAIEADAGELPDASAPVQVPDANGVVDAASFDAQVVDAGNDAAMCVAEGEDCQTGACCDGTACVTSTAAPFPACLETCTADSECESGCCTALSGSAKVCAAASYCEAEDETAPLVGVNCFGDRLEVFDSDGVTMGKASSKFFATDGVCNDTSPYGKYGSNANKLWNITSDAYSTSLAFSAVIGCGSDWPVLAYVSK